MHATADCTGLDLFGVGPEPGRAVFVESAGPDLADGEKTSPIIASVSAAVGAEEVELGGLVQKLVVGPDVG